MYWVKFVDINSARIAKKKVDSKSYFGKNLHVSYAPEFESVEETREKLAERKATIAQKTRRMLTYVLVPASFTVTTLLPPYLFISLTLSLSPSLPLSLHSVSFLHLSLPVSLPHFADSSL